MKKKKYTPVNKGHSFGLETQDRLDSFTKKELVQIILDEDWCGKNMAEKVVDAWLEFERS